MLTKKSWWFTVWRVAQKFNASHDELLFKKTNSGSESSIKELGQLS